MICAYNCCINEVIQSKEHGKRNKKKYCSEKCSAKASVYRRRKKLKALSVEYLGGKCHKCGYNKCMSALEFHHKNPEEKSFNISHNRVHFSIEGLKEELNKCELVCANCH